MGYSEQVLKNMEKAFGLTIKTDGDKNISGAKKPAKISLTEKEFYKMLSKNLRVARIKTGFTQEDVAAVIGVSHATPATYEVSRFNPPIIKLYQLADLYNVSLDELCGREGGEP